ncbi:MAG: peroxiredoxin [Methanomassiliicoccales archaeon]
MTEDIEESAYGFPRMGEKFPQMDVRTTHGEIRLPSYFMGKWFLLFSHPADFTPVCTTEFVGFAKRQEQFREMGCELVGHSVDFIFSHIKWIEWIKENLGVDIEFPVISDPYGKIAEQLGVLHPIEGVGAVRAVFLVDDKGQIRLIMYYPQRVGRNLDELLRIVRATRLAWDEDVAIPANWPNNELIGDEVLEEPPMDMEGAMSRKGGEKCYDWWFCTRKL